MRAAIAAALLLSMTGAARADDAAVAVPEADAFRSKKDRYLDAKGAPAEAAPIDKQAWQKSLDQRIGKPPAEVVNIFNHHTREYLPIKATVEPAVPKEVTDRFFRCHFTNEPTQMDAQLFGLLVQAAKRFRADRVNIVSGFRSPKYNLILRKKGREVARDSQHTHGRAVDFRIPGVPVRTLYRWVRSLRLGGVGFYSDSKFIHADTWRVRTWTGN